jgi:hypothetical protein
VNRLYKKFSYLGYLGLIDILRPRALVAIDTVGYRRLYMIIPKLLGLVRISSEPREGASLTLSYG